MKLGDLFDRILLAHKDDPNGEDAVWRIMHLLLWRDRASLRVAWSK